MAGLEKNKKIQGVDQQPARTRGQRLGVYDYHGVRACVHVKDPHIVQRDVLPCQQYERASEINGVCECASGVSTEVKGHDFCPMTSFTTFPLRKALDPAPS